VLLLFVYGRVLAPRYICDAGKYRTMLHYQILCETQQICHRDICFFNRSLWRCHSIENYGFLSGTKVFKEGRENVEDDHRSGRTISPTNDQNVEVVRAVMAKDRRLNVRMIAEETGLDKVQFIEL